MFTILQTQDKAIDLNVFHLSKSFNNQTVVFFTNKASVATGFILLVK